MGEYLPDRKWSDPYIPPIMQIVGPLLLRESPLDMDVHQATDLVVISAEPITVACRVRRPGYLNKKDWGWQVTIRYHRDNGMETEYSKVRQGWCDWAFYGHAAQSKQAKIARWFLYDFNVWRLYFENLEDPRHNEHGIICGLQPNGDGTHFAWFDIRTFPPEPPILIASSCHVPNMETASMTQATFEDSFWAATLQAGPPPGHWS